MPKITTTAKELGDADVSFISLVKRPANRVPFRITKSDNSINPEGSDFMFNINSVLKREGKTKKAETPAVAALAIKKEDADALVPVLLKKGFKTEDTIERDGILILKQETEFNESDLVAFKMDDNVVAMVSNVKKSFHAFGDSLSFADNIASQGFMPGIFVATDALLETFHNILYASNNSSDVRMKMQTAIGEYSSFVIKMAEELPEIVFKLEGDQFDITAGAVTKGDDSTESNQEEGEGIEENTTKSDDEGTESGDPKESTGDESNDPDTDGVADSGTQVSKNEDNGDVDDGTKITEALKGDIDNDILNPTVAKGEDESGAKAETPKVDVESTVSKGDSDNGNVELMTLLTTIQKQLKDGMAGVNDKLEVVEKSTSKLSDRLDTVEKVAKAAESAVNGTVLSGSDSVIRSEGLGNQTRTMKSEVQAADEDLWGDSALDNLIN